MHDTNYEEMQALQLRKIKITGSVQNVIKDQHYHIYIPAREFLQCSDLVRNTERKKEKKAEG